MRETINITRGTDVVLNDRLIFRGKTFDPSLAVNLDAHLVSRAGVRTALGVEVVDDYLVISIPWVTGRMAGLYGLEVRGMTNGLRWATYADSLIRYTTQTAQGDSEEVTVSGDAYDITQQVSYRFGESPISEALVTVDNNVGEPSVAVSYASRVLQLAFSCLKGNGIRNLVQTSASAADNGENIWTVTFDDGSTATMTIRNGSRGNGIANVVRMAESADYDGVNIWRVVTTDGVYFDITVKNGSRGNGIESVVKTESSDEDGGVNTWRQTLTDGTVVDISVRNGRRGAQGPQGDSVIVGQGDLPLAHVLGQDNTKAMSQKGVSDVLYPLVGDYYYEVEIAATQEGKYLAGTSVIATASSTPTLNIAFYEIPEDADSATISIPKTGSSSCKVYAYANSTSATKVSSPTESGNSGAKNLTIQPNHQYKYLLVSYNSTSGEPTVQFHKPAKDWSDVMKASEIYRNFSKTYTKDECNVSGEYIASNGTLKTGYSAFKRSDFLSTMRASKITITCGYTSTDAAIVAFYGEGQNFLSGILANGQNAQEYDVPVLARYIRISNKSESAISIVLDAVEINGFNATIDELTSEIEQVKATMPPRFINILHIGNSFTMNTHTNLGTLLSHLGVTNVNIQHTNVGGAGLESFVTKLNNSTTIAVETTRGLAVAADGSLQSILSHDWDVIVFQQVSASAGIYSSYNPYLAILINAARKYCTRKDVKIGFETVWRTYMTTFASVLEATRSMMADYNIDFLIPAGTAVENARLTSMNTDVNDFSSDAQIQHLAVGVGRYVAACAFYCEVLEPMTGIPVYNDTTTTVSASGTGSVAVTDDNRELCQKCAEYAVIHPYGTINVEDL